MKLTKQQLKGIVKECLIEILSEGLGSINSSVSSSGSQIQKEIVTAKQKQQSIVEKTMPLIKNLTSDKLMQELMEDTAKNTLPQILDSTTAEKPAEYGAMDIAQRTAYDLDPTELINKNWVDAAFK